MTYDPVHLKALGRRNRKMRADLIALRNELTPEILAAHEAGIPQNEIAEMAGFTREVIRQICLTPEQREAERERRNQRTRKGAE